MLQKSLFSSCLQISSCRKNRPPIVIYALFFRFSSGSTLPFP